MSLRKNFGTDKVAEQDGVDVAVATNEHDGTVIAFRLSRMGSANKRYVKALEAATQPYQTEIQNETLDNEISRKLFREVFVDSVLLGWTNVPTSELTGNADDKSPLPYSRDNALALFDALPDLYDTLQQKSAKLATFRAKATDINAKN